ncbi:cysteine desulfurase family protein [Alkalihalobacillus sp. LMS39]|uniref:cysteine desulfurase family protein n=1 Tax=Alkalihalobacillus sp. LMS39 TaxID=2924032 RepID=UPI001FB2257F|nr:cysteine desulfurase family protein [Alkalihalobacillus sp. LMS39]UOE95563.1 cysteine desulfurase [Alkalihalobacillus sp. LMS39]
MNEIYVDHAATSPVHPTVVEEMLPFFTEQFGNPSSIHRFGRQSRQALDKARMMLAKTIGATPEEIIFTSGGTEADNIAIIGYAKRNQHKGKHIITTTIEHHAVLHSCKSLEELGFEVTYVPVNDQGEVNVQDVVNEMKEDTILVTIMYGNNEIGTVQPIAEIGAILKERNIAFHTDAVQAYGIERLNVNELNVDFLSVSSHKINGPKGVGMLFARKGRSFLPSLFGGEQERKRRAGTENVAGIVGFAKAAELLDEQREEKRVLYKQFQDKMLDIWTAEGVKYVRNGSASTSLPHILNVSFAGVSVESLLVNLDLVGIAASSGSACTAGTLQISHVLEAISPGHEKNSSAIRFSFGYGNTLEQIETVANETIKAIKRIQR